MISRKFRDFSLFLYSLQYNRFFISFFYFYRSNIWLLISNRIWHFIGRANQTFAIEIWQSKVKTICFIFWHFLPLSNIFLISSFHIIFHQAPRTRGGRGGLSPPTFQNGTPSNSPKSDEKSKSKKTPTPPCCHRQNFSFFRQNSLSTFSVKSYSIFLPNLFFRQILFYFTSISLSVKIDRRLRYQKDF